MEKPHNPTQEELEKFFDYDQMPLTEVAETNLSGEVEIYFEATRRKENRK